MIFKSNSAKEDYWISVSDLMAALMVIFLFIAISYMIKVQKQFDAFVYLHKEYLEAQEAIYEELEEEFADDLKDWKAEIDKKTLAVIFHEPETLFEVLRWDIKPIYKSTLKDFFPRYIEAILRTDYQSFISKLRIEGHASPGWTGGTPKDKFINNMDLSQKRSSEVMKFVLKETDLKDDFGWVKKNLISVGYGPTVPVFNQDSTINKSLSRRVEFRVVMNAQEELFKILGGEIPKRYKDIRMSKKDRADFLNTLPKTSGNELKIRK
jgi:outer membrane protein OmpA-like peptidoglycan-associated protein